MRMSVEEVRAFLADAFPQSLAFGTELVSLGDGVARVTLRCGDEHLRPGGTVSGPVLFTLADHALYCLVLATLGPVALAVTTHTSIDFLRRPEPGVLSAEAELLKLGRRLAVGRVTIRNEPGGEIVAHASMTYSLPPAAPAA
jgi:uncharacterized protein (TIGR00369 family)